MKYFLFFMLAAILFVANGQDTLRTPVSYQGKWGYVNQSGDTIINPIYTWVGEFHEGIARVYLGGRMRQDMGPVPEGGKYGFIDRNGNPVTEYKYDNAKDFQNGLARVRVYTPTFNSENYINKYGREIVPQNHQIAYQKPFGAAPHKGMAILISSKEIPSFEKVHFQLAKEYLEKHPKCSGVLRERSQNAVGVLDSSGSVIVEAQFNDIGFSQKENLIYVTKQDDLQKLRGLYNFDGQVILEPKYLKISEFKNGVATVLDKNGLYGLIDTKGAFLLDCKFKQILIENTGVHVSSRDSCDTIRPHTDTLVVMDEGLNRFKRLSFYHSHRVSYGGNCPNKPVFITFHQLDIQEE